MNKETINTDSNSNDLTKIDHLLPFLRGAIASYLVFLLLAVICFFSFGRPMGPPFIFYLVPGLIVFSVVAFLMTAVLGNCLVSNSASAIGLSIVALVPILGLPVLLILERLAVGKITSATLDEVNLNNNSLPHTVTTCVGIGLAILFSTAPILYWLPAGTPKIQRIAGDIFEVGTADPNEISEDAINDMRDEFESVLKELEKLKEGQAVMTTVQVRDNFSWLATISEKAAENIPYQQLERFQKLRRNRSELMKVATAPARPDTRETQRKVAKGKGKKAGSNKKTGSNRETTANAKGTAKGNVKATAKKQIMEIVVEISVEKETKLSITKGNMRLVGEPSSWPKSVKINGTQWDPAATPKFLNSANKFFSGKPDFDAISAEIMEGRGKAVISKTNVGATLRVVDNEEGSAPYKILVTVAKIGKPPAGKSSEKASPDINPK